MSSLFSLPNEVVLSALYSRFPSRDQQIRSLATLVSIGAAPTRNVVLYGLEATGKSAITRALLEELSERNANSALRYAIVKSAECISGRHLLEQTVGSVAKAVGWTEPISRCENLSQLPFAIGKLLEHEKSEKRRLVLVFDGIDQQRDAPPTLLPALARMGEIIPNLTIVFIVISPRPNFLHLPGVPHIHFPPYTKAALLSILALTIPPALPSQWLKETQETWSRYCSAVYDSLSKHSGRDLLSFRSVCLRLWPQFIKPIISGQSNPTPFSKLLLATRPLFQDASVLVHSMIANPASTSMIDKDKKNQGIALQLPFYSRLLLVAAYLASYNAPKTDSTHFLRQSLSARRKKGGGTALTSRTPGVSKSRKIPRRLLGPQAFVLERMLAIFHAISESAKRKVYGVKGSADIQMAITTLVSLRLLTRMGGDLLEGTTRYRVAVGWEVVRGVARSVGVEAGDYLAE